jgi:hypothetical protein
MKSPDSTDFLSPIQATLSTCAGCTRKRAAAVKVAGRFCSKDPRKVKSSRPAATCRATFVA